MMKGLSLAHKKWRAPMCNRRR